MKFQEKLMQFQEKMYSQDLERERVSSSENILPKKRFIYAFG